MGGKDSNSRGLKNSNTIYTGLIELWNGGGGIYRMEFL